MYDLAALLNLLCYRQLPTVERQSLRSSAMFDGGALVSFVKRLFGRRAMKSDDSADCQPAAVTSAVGDCNGNVPPSASRHPAVTPSTWTARGCRHRGGNVVLVCRRCGGRLLPAAADPRRWSLSRYDVRSRDYGTHAADDGVGAVCCCQNCSCCYAGSLHPIHQPRVSTQLN